MKKKAKTESNRTVSNEPIHAKLTQLRMERGLSQTEVGAAVNLTQALVSNYEKGTRRLHAELVVRFAKFYGVSADELLGIKGGKNQKRTTSDLGLHLLKRMQKIQNLPKKRQKEVLKSIDFVLNGAEK